MAAKKKPATDETKSGSTRSIREDEEKEHVRTQNNSPTLKELTLDQIIHEFRVRQIKLEMQADALRQSETLLRSMIESPQSIIIFSLDRNFRYLAFNTRHQETMKAIWGVDIKTGMNMLEVIGYERDRKSAQLNFERALSGEHFTLTEDYGDANLSRKFWENTYSPICDEHHNVTGLTVYVIDVTERKRAEEALFHQTATLSILNDIISTANKADNLPQLLESILEESLRLLDFDAGGIYLVDRSTRTANVVHSKNLPPGFLAEIQTVPIDKKPYDTLFIKNEPIITENYEQIVKDQSKTFGLQSLASIPLISKGVTIGALNVASTKRQVVSPDEKQTLLSIAKELGSTIQRMTAEEEVKKAAKNLDTLFNSIDEMIFVLDMQGCILAVNNTVFKRLLYTPESLIGTNVLLLHVPERRDEALLNVQGMIAGTIDSCPVPVLAKDGTRIAVETKVTRGWWNGKEVLIGVTRDVTERKRAEDALLQLTDRLALATRAGGVGIWDYDVVNNTLTWDDQMFALYGIRREQFGGAYEAWQAGLHPEDRERGDAEIQQALRKEKEFDTEFRVLWPDGSIRTIRALALVQRDASGKSLRMIGTNWDITAQKKAEENIKRQASLIKSLLDSIPDIIFFKDKEGVYLGCNPPFFEFVGKSREEIIGRTDYELFDKEIADFFRGHDKRMLESGEPRHNEEWITYPDGRKILIDTLKTPYWGPDGMLMGVLGISRDITERKRAEEALHESEERYRSLYVDSREAIMIVSPERGYLAANPATIQLFACRNEQDFIAHTPASLSPEYQPDGVLSTDKFQEMMHLALEKGSCFFEWMHRKIDGTDFPATVLLSRLESSGTHLLQATVRDVTIPKEAEKALKVYSERLEELVEERTKKLSDAQRLATIGETATMVGHDLRNPLQVTINAIYLVKMWIDKMSPGEREVILKYHIDDMCRTVDEQSSYMNKIVSDLQDYARPIKITRAMFPLRTFFDEIIATIDHEENITVRVGIDRNYEITSDRDLIKRAVTNLLTNAFQSIIGEGTIDISARREGDYNEIEIRDSGAGMDPATLERVFQPLFTTKPKGTGLGLNVSRRLIMELGGTLEMKSRKGEGTTAVIRLPVAGK